jgi:hypothetical protein
MGTFALVAAHSARPIDYGVSDSTVVFTPVRKNSRYNPVYVRRVDLSDLAFSLPSNRHSYRSLLLNSRFID